MLLSDKYTIVNKQNKTTVSLVMAQVFCKAHYPAFPKEFHIFKPVGSYKQEYGNLQFGAFFFPIFIANRKILKFYMAKTVKQLKQDQKKKLVNGSKVSESKRSVHKPVGLTSVWFLRWYRY